jgi:hypothetical protein
MTTNQPQVTRFLGLDIVRLVSFIAILIFHISFVHFYSPSIESAAEHPLIKMLETYARTFSFSGFTIVFLTSLLTAYSGKGLAKRGRLMIFLIFGWAIFSALMAGSGNLLLTWDVYPLILVGILTATLAEMGAPWFSRILAILGLALLFVPFWEWSQPLWMSTDLATVMGFGDCTQHLIEWPVLPWIGLVWGGYGVGQGLREMRQAERLMALRMSPVESLTWAVVLMASLPQLGAFFDIRLGRYFACDAYRQPPLTWWSHLLWVFFAVRLSVEPRIAAWCTSNSLCMRIGNLAISRKFWVAYFCSYLLGFIASELGTASQVEQTSWRLEAIAFVGIAYIIGTEFLTRIVLFLGDVFLENFGRPEGLEEITGSKAKV